MTVGLSPRSYVQYFKCDSNLCQVDLFYTLFNLTILALQSRMSLHNYCNLVFQLLLPFIYNDLLVSLFFFYPDFIFSHLNKNFARLNGVLSELTAKLSISLFVNMLGGNLSKNKQFAI